MIPMVYYAGPSAEAPPDEPGVPGDPPRRPMSALSLLTRAMGVALLLLLWGCYGYGG
jgi:hypothetical protein